MNPHIGPALVHRCVPPSVIGPWVSRGTFLPRVKRSFIIFSLPPPAIMPPPTNNRPFELILGQNIQNECLPCWRVYFLLKKPANLGANQTERVTVLVAMPLKHGALLPTIKIHAAGCESTNIASVCDGEEGELDSLQQRLGLKPA